MCEIARLKDLWLGLVGGCSHLPLNIQAFVFNMQEQEIWKPVKSKYGNYFVSNYGRVKREEVCITYKDGRKRVFERRIMKQTSAKHGNVVSIDGKSNSVPKLVLMAFVENPNNYLQFYHKDNDVRNNRADNLCWGLRERVVFEQIEKDETEKEYINRLYNITADGKVFRKQDCKELKGCKTPKGYIHIRLKCPKFAKNKDRRKSYKIHRLVAMFHLDNYDEKLQVNHINGIKDDNRVENLEMVTNSENALHAWRVLNSKERRNAISKANSKRKTANI